MKREHISDAVGNISPEFIQEAADYTPIAAYTVETVRFNAAVEYLRARGFDVTDRSDYSQQDVIREAERIQVMDVEADPAFFSPTPADPSAPLPPARPTEPTDVTSDQVRRLTPTMTLNEVTDLLGDTMDVGSGICILVYRVDNAYTLTIPFAGPGDTQLGVTGEELLLMLDPIE